MESFISGKNWCTHYGFYFGTLKIGLLTAENFLCTDFLSRFYCSSFQLVVYKIVRYAVRWYYNGFQWTCQAGAYSVSDPVDTRFSFTGCKASRSWSWPLTYTAPALCFLLLQAHEFPPAAFHSSYQHLSTLHTISFDS